MPLYDLKCAKCGKEKQSFIDIKVYAENGGGSCECGGLMERDFSKGVANLDGVSQNHWPREDWTQARDKNGKPHVIHSRRQQDREYKAKNWLRG